MKRAKKVTTDLNKFNIYFKIYLTSHGFYQHLVESIKFKIRKRLLSLAIAPISGKKRTLKDLNCEYNNFRFETLAFHSKIHWKLLESQAKSQPLSACINVWFQMMLFYLEKFNNFWFLMMLFHLESWPLIYRHLCLRCWTSNAIEECKKSNNTIFFLPSIFTIIINNWWYDGVDWNWISKIRWMLTFDFDFEKTIDNPLLLRNFNIFRRFEWASKSIAYTFNVRHRWAFEEWTHDHNWYLRSFNLIRKNSILL